MTVDVPSVDRGGGGGGGGGGGQGDRTPAPGKSQVIWVSIGNKQLDPPPPLENVVPPLEP